LSGYKTLKPNIITKKERITMNDNEMNYDTELYNQIKVYLKDIVKGKNKDILVNELFQKGCEYINEQIKNDTRLKEIYQNKDNLEFIYAGFTLIRDNQLRKDKKMEKIYHGKSKSYYKNLPD
jgi:hypothetical protein